MCGHVQKTPPVRTTEQPPKRQRQRAETMPKGSLASTIDVDALSGVEQQLVGFAAVYVNDRPAGVFWPIYSGETLFGRAGGGAQPEIGLNAPSVSAKHARVFANPVTKTFTLHDMGSRNGTELNGTKLRSGEAKPFEDNAVIKLGLVTIVVKLLPR
jgi:pSer/pThr/pTyr-binding forkhead associated (FHA) protein